MKVLVGFLLLSFILGGLANGRSAARHPYITLGCCVVVGISFLSLSIIQ